MPPLCLLKCHMKISGQGPLPWLMLDCQHPDAGGSFLEVPADQPLSDDPPLPCPVLRGTPSVLYLQTMGLLTSLMGRSWGGTSSQPQSPGRLIEMRNKYRGKHSFHKQTFCFIPEFSPEVLGLSGWRYNSKVSIRRHLDSSGLHFPSDGTLPTAFRQAWNPRLESPVS